MVVYIIDEWDTERIMNDIKIWDFVEVKKVVNDDEFFY